MENINTFYEANTDNFDRDSDGYPDAQEASAGTDPDDPTDQPDEDPWDTTHQITDPNGFYFTFFKGIGEKLFEPKPIFLNSMLLFNTYVPPVSGGGAFDPCDPGGDLFIYSFRLNASSNETGVEFTDVTDGRIVGSGVLSGGKAMLYVGGGEIGSTQIKD